MDSVSFSKVCQEPLHLTYSPLARGFITASGVDGNASFNAGQTSLLTCHDVQDFAQECLLHVCKLEEP
jgi:hypothetical protein